MAAVGEPPPKWEEYPSRNGKLGHGNWMKLGGDCHLCRKYRKVDFILFLFAFLISWIWFSKLLSILYFRRLVPHLSLAFDQAQVLGHSSEERYEYPRERFYCSVWLAEAGWESFASRAARLTANVSMFSAPRYPAIGDSWRDIGTAKYHKLRGTKRCNFHLPFGVSWRFVAMNPLPPGLADDAQTYCCIPES